MKEIIRITLGLTLSCLIAAFVMGAVFTVTSKAKRHNEHLRIQRTMLGLLGYNRSNPPPEDLELYSLFRYIIAAESSLKLGYLIPVGRHAPEGYDLIILNLNGTFHRQLPVTLDPDSASQPTERQQALANVLPPGHSASYADSVIIAARDSKRIAYLLPAEFPGFKTLIRVMLALDPSFDILGLEIMEQEEDPGLGAEIEEPYFKNQFIGKSLQTIKTLDVIKKPIPEDYLNYLEKGGRELSREELIGIRSKYEDRDIYALTGATISSRAVTSGVKNSVRKFAYRIEILDHVLEGQKITVPF